MTRILRFLWLLPRNGAIAALCGYRAVVSPLYGEVCRYYPSCSAYALGSVQQRGLVVGVLLSAARLVRCHPWARGGVDDVRMSRRQVQIGPFGFVTGTASVAYSTSVVAGGPIDAGNSVVNAQSHAHSHGKG